MRRFALRRLQRRKRVVRAKHVAADIDDVERARITRRGQFLVNTHSGGEPYPNPDELCLRVPAWGPRLWVGRPRNSVRLHGALRACYSPRSVRKSPMFEALSKGFRAAKNRLSNVT